MALITLIDENTHFFFKIVGGRQENAVVLVQNVLSPRVIDSESSGRVFFNFEVANGSRGVKTVADLLVFEVELIVHYI